jgi:hypothetical protein
VPTARAKIGMPFHIPVRLTLDQIRSRVRIDSIALETTAASA